MISLLILFLILFAVIRLVTAPFRFARRRRFYGNPYQYGCRRHHGIVGGIFPIIALVALDRIFGGRRF